jgi:hypothetical protein
MYLTRKEIVEKLSESNDNALIMSLYEDQEYNLQGFNTFNFGEDAVLGNICFCGDGFDNWAMEFGAFMKYSNDSNAVRVSNCFDDLLEVMDIGEILESLHFINQVEVSEEMDEDELVDIVRENWENNNLAVWCEIWGR